MSEDRKPVPEPTQEGPNLPFSERLAEIITLPDFLQREKIRIPWTAVVIGGLIWLYFTYFGAVTVLQHNTFQTTAFDLGNVDQAVWNTRHGRLFHMTNIEGLTNRLGTHVEPILLPISLLYFAWSDPRVLLLLQTAVIALGAWPVYLLVRRRFADASGQVGTQAKVLGIVFALVYLLFPALQSANTFDFHAVALAPTFFLFALYFLETEQWAAYALFAVLTMSCKEDMPLLVVMLGLYAILVRRRWRVGLATVGAAVVWFLVAVGVVMPHFDTRGVSPLANRYAYLGDGPLEMAATLLTRPGVVLDQLRAAGAWGYLRDLLAPVAYLSLLAPQVLLLTLPPLLVNLLSTEGAMHQLEGFHYGAVLVPAVVVAAAYGVSWLARRFPRVRALPYVLAAVVLAASLLYHYGHGYTFLAESFTGWPVVTEHHILGEEMARSIPPEASLAALPRPNPHASQREQLSMIDRVEGGQPAPLQGIEYDRAEYAWFDVTDGWPLHPNDLRTGVENLLAGGYGVAQAADGWLLLRHGAPDRVLPDDFYDFARAPNPQPQYAARLQFLLDGAPALETLGFDLIFDPRTSTHRLTFYWRALRPLPPGLRLYPFYFDDATGEILEDTSERPLIATVWYPPERWQVGEVVKTSPLPWDVGADFSVGLGVVRQSSAQAMAWQDWADTGQRLPIRVEAAGGAPQVVVRLFDKDTWARLLQVQDGEPVEEYRQFEAPTPQHPLDADLEGQVRLLGYDLEGTRSGELDITLYWQAQTRLETRYTVFLQALDGAGQVGAQSDSEPQGGGYPTVWWLPGEVVADPHHLTLPSGARQGTYRLIAGLYDPTTAARLSVTGTNLDYVELQATTP